MPKTNISLVTTDGITEPIPVPLISNRVSAQIQNASGTTWSSAVVDIQWNLDPENNSGWANFSPQIQWTTSAKVLAAVSVTNRGWIRWKTTTAEPANDPAATIVYSIT